MSKPLNDDSTVLSIGHRVVNAAEQVLDLNEQMRSSAVADREMKRAEARLRIAVGDLDEHLALIERARKDGSTA